MLRVHSMVPTSRTSSPGQVIIFLLWVSPVGVKKREQREKEERQQKGAQICHKPAVTSCVSSFLAGCSSQGGFEDAKGLSCGAKGRLRERAEREGNRLPPGKRRFFFLGCRKTLDLTKARQGKLYLLSPCDARCKDGKRNGFWDLTLF
ncbi:hypothetical protein QOT17_021863 [Balamuthia mandrillaris]